MEQIMVERMSGVSLETNHYWKVRVDCWYEPQHHIKAGAKPLGNKRDVRTVVIGPCKNVEEAREQAVVWAEGTAEIGRKWLGFEFMGASPVTFPLDVTHKY